jgi:hypothetical protein
MIKSLFFTIVLLIGVECFVKACCQECNTSSLNMCRGDSIIEDNACRSFDEIKVNSLQVVSVKLDSILSSIIKEKSKKSIWNFFYITLAKVDSSLYIEIVADISNERIFMNKKNELIYGEFKLNNNVMFVLKYDSINQIKDSDIGKMFLRTGHVAIIKKRKGPNMYYTKYENPMWLYQFKDRDVFLLKSTNTEYYNRHSKI